MQSAEESNEIEGIHPVNDGNGCMRRLLTTLLLYRAGHIIGRYVSLESKIAKDKEPYYATIEQCQNGWHVNAEDSAQYIKYLLRTILAAHHDFEERIDMVDGRQSAVETVRCAVFGLFGKL